jgi:hypothetical protein
VRARLHAGVHPGAVRRGLLLGASTLAAGACGAAAGRSEVGAVAPLAALCLLVTAAAAALIVRRASRDVLVGVAAGVLALGAVNALPGPNLQANHIDVRTPYFSFGRFPVLDFCVAALIVLLASGYRQRIRPVTPARYSRIARAACLLLSLWWLITVLRSWIGSGVSLPRGAFFGRDFLYFAVLIPLAIPLMQSAPRRQALVAVLAVGAVVTGVGQALIALGVGSVPQIVHVSDLGRDSGLVRVHSPASTLVAAALPFALGAVLFGRGPARVLAGVVATVSAISIALQLTRALYFGLLLGLAVAVVVSVFLTSRAEVGRRRLMRIAATCAVVIAAVAIYEPSATANSAVNGVRTRFLSGVAEFTQTPTTKSTLAFRDRERSVLQPALRGHELAGLGFLPPTTFAVAGLPKWTEGSIRNSDVGVYNVLMTMGLIGVVIYALPLLAAGWAGIARRHEVRGEERWLAFGCLAWLIMAIVTSWNLVLLFSPSGAVLSALILACMLATSEEVVSRS